MSARWPQPCFIIYWGAPLIGANWGRIIFLLKRSAFIAIFGLFALVTESSFSFAQNLSRSNAKGSAAQTTPRQTSSPVALVAQNSSVPTYPQTVPATPTNEFGKNYRPGEIILKVKTPVPNKFSANVNVQQMAQQMTQQFFARHTQAYSMRILSSFSEMGMHHVAIDPSLSVEQVVNELNQSGDVEYAEPNYILQKATTAGYQVEQSYTLSQIISFGGVLTTAHIQDSAAWSLYNYSGSNPVVVAVIDSGLDFTHPAFANSVWTNPNEIPDNGIDDDQNGYVDDVHGWNFVNNTNNATDDEGHGTHVSGVVLGVSENIFDNNVPAGPIQIMPLKFLNSQGIGANSDAIKAIYYAAKNGAKVINASWGGNQASQALNDAIAFSYSQDLVFVTAAGNSSSNNDSVPNYPASYTVPNIVAVAATDDTDIMANFSNYGSRGVGLSAPGVSILSTYPYGQYAQMSGTSMASPFVAGTAALMRFGNPAMNSYQIKQLLLNTVDQKANLAGYVESAGRVNVFHAVQMAQSTIANPYMPAYSSAQSSTNRSPASMGCGLVSLVGEDIGRFGSPPRQMVVVTALLLMPLLLIIALRRPEKAVSRRKFDRFAINTSVVFKMGEKELEGSVRSISMGGSDLNTEALLRDGSLITMTISAPDGSTKVEVQGHVVWGETNKRYGIAFDNLTEKIKTEIGHWTKSLQKV